MAQIQSKKTTTISMHVKLRIMGGGGGAFCCIQYCPFVPLHVNEHKFVNEPLLSRGWEGGGSA